MEKVPPPAEELALIDRELTQLDARRALLLTRRAWLLTVLQPPAPVAPAAAFAPPRETSPPSVQNVLLTLGGVLLTIAAVAFTLVSWGRLGIGGRSAVLGVVTVAALAAPVRLLRRGLRSTAESVAGLGLVLMVLDAYALHRVALSGVDGTGYAAVASAVLASLWTAYGLALGRLRLPLPVAVVTAQLPLQLWAVAADAGASVAVWALLATAVADAAVALWARGLPVVRVLSAVGAGTVGGWSLLVAGGLSVTADGPAGAVGPAGVLLVAAGVALFAAMRVPPARAEPRAWGRVSAAAVTCAAVAGLSVVVAVGGVARPVVPAGWAVPVYAACAVVLLAVVRAAGLPRRLMIGLVGAAGAVQGVAVLWALPAVALVLVGPVRWVGEVWSGAPSGGAQEALWGALPWSGSAATPVVLLLAAGVLWAAYRWADASWRPATAGGAVILVWAAGMMLPTALDPGYGVTVAVRVVLTAVLVAVAVRFGAAGPSAAARTGAGDGVLPGAEPGGAGAPAANQEAGAAGVAGAPGRTDAVAAAVGAVAFMGALVGAVSVSLLALAVEAATYGVLGALTAVFVVAAAFGAGPVRRAAASAGVAWAAGLVCAVAAGYGLPTHQVALAVLVVPAVVVVAAARLGRHPAGLPMEITGAVVGLPAVGLASGHAPTLSLVLSLCGVFAAGTAVRADRRPVGYAAVVLFVLAMWVRLAASGVAAPEAYTLPVTVPALAVGVLRCRRDPEASSWTAYGPGLAATLVPSLIAAWGDEHWLRPLLLGLAALVVTLAGARLRLQALLVLGGVVLALDALHELAPYVVQVVGALPRWLPPALAGLLLLGVGATYEQRLRDARRLRDTLGRMR
ncbi:hypothetical protein GCM10020367_11180 [Streptomyces sannanensis]|uniref:Integral membrane protein n=1 Tax=Streptomyces sannanensis TaxID=285536 RepID=A0ABP6S6M4_9ACTN